MTKSNQGGLSLIELLVVLAIIGVLWALALPSMGRGMVKGVHTQTLSNMKQLHLATQQMAMDGTTTSDTNIGWPGDTGGSFETWATNLVGGNYLSTNDLCKLLSAKGRITAPGRIPRGNTNAVIVYAVSGTTDGNAVFLSTANFTNTPTGGLPPLKNALPYGQTGFVVFHKAGDGVILANRQLGPAYTNIIGSYAPLCTGPAGPEMVDVPFELSWLTVLIGTSLLLLAGMFALTFIMSRRSSAQSPLHRARQLLACMNQIYFATQQMALEGQSTGEANLGWPGDTDGTFSTWASMLVSGEYVSAEDLRRMLEGTYGTKRRWFAKRNRSIPSENTHPIRVYAVREDSPASTIFLTSANFLHTPEGGTVVEDSPLLDGKYFVILRRDGQGLIIALQPPSEDGRPIRELCTAEKWAKLPRAYEPLCD